jgi:hypothetical protein
MNAKWERETANRSADSGNLNEILYPSEFVSDGIFVTKRGHVAGVFRIQPAPFEILDLTNLELITDRIEAALRGLDPAIRVYQYLVKSRIPSGLYQIRIYWALVYENRPNHDWWSWFYFPRAGTVKIDSEIMSSATILGMHMDILTGAIAGAERMGREDTFQFLRRLVNFSEDGGLKLCEPWGIDHQMSCENVKAHEELIVGRHHLRVLTMKVTPRWAHANLWAKVLDIPCEFIATQEWKPSPPAQTERIIKAKKSHLAQKLKGWRANLGEMASLASSGPSQQLHPSQMLIDGSKAAQIKELEEAQEAISKEGVHFGEYSLTFVLHSEDIVELRAGISAVLNVVHPHGAQVSEGLGQAALAAWLAIVPGHERINVRRLEINNAPVARMSFVFGPSEGNPYNPFLKAPCLSEWTTERGTPYYLNLHRGQVGHTLITGTTGMGKSYAMRWLIEDSQKYQPQTIIFDVTSSFRDLTEEHDGSYLEMGSGARRQDKINPFALPPDKDNFAFNTSLVRMLIESDGGPTLDAEETQDIYEQVVSLMTTNLPSESRRLSNLHPQPHLARRLARWVGDGQHAWLFDNAEDTLSFATFQTFSFLGMAQDKEALTALLFYVLHRSLQIIYQTDRPSFVWMDEAINFLENEVMRDYIFKALLNWRKQQAALILVLHSLTDIPHDTAVRLLQGCMTRLHLANPGIDPAAWRELLHCSQAQVDIIRRLTPARQVLVEGAGIMNLVASPERDARLATHLEKATA